MTRKFNISLLGAALLVMLNACNSGSTSVAEGGIGGTGMTVGTITSFGSIFVNGIEFDTSSAAVEVDGQAGLDDSALAVGMVVSVEGSVSSDGHSGTASSVVSRNELEGPVSANNMAVDNSLIVMGQTVRVAPQTVYEANGSGYPTLADIPADGSVVVEVNGYPDGTGLIYATRIEVVETGWSSGDSEIEVKGIVESVDEPNSTFTLGGLTVSYAALGAAPTSGQYVQVTSTTGFDGNGYLVASAIDLEEGGDLALDGMSGDEYELEGVITSALSSGLFGLNGSWVRIGAGTDTGGSDLATLGNVVEVHGVLAADGILDATEIRERAGASIHVAAEVEGVDSATSTITVMGLPVSVTATTVVTDDTGTIIWPLQLASLLNGYVELEIGRDSGDNLVAVRLEVVQVSPPLPGEVELEGKVTSLTPLQLETVSITDNNGLLPPATAVGDELNIVGTWDGLTLSATSIE